MKNHCEIEIVVQETRGVLQAHARQRLEQQDMLSHFAVIDLDPKAPEFFSGDARTAGEKLTQALLQPADIRDALVSACSTAAAKNLPLRVRLRIDQSAARLHDLPWETLVDPRSPSQFLFKDSSCVFSRYLFSRELRPPLLRARRDMRALVAIANPRNLGEALTFTGDQIKQQLDVAKTALHPLPVHTLEGPARVTLAGLMEALKDEVDILFLACHGVKTSEGYALWLEDSDGKGERVDAEAFAARIGELAHPPSLIVLCSCLSAGTGFVGRDELAALGPLLAMQGVPAVLAMQGRFSFASAQTYLPVFFKELARHGEVDLAAASARLAILQNNDWWMPVVFTRLDSARIWYPPGFDQADSAGDVWASMVNNIKDRTCTPILGPTFTDHMFKSRREMARDWVEAYRYPMSGRDVEDFPQVAQYLATTRDESFLRKAFYQGIRDSLFENFGQQHADMDWHAPSLNELLSTTGRRLRASDPLNPYSLLASYKLPVYLTADPSNLLRDALIEAGAKPRTRLVRWNTAATYHDMLLLEQSAVAASKSPSPEEPIIVKLFGDLDDAGTLVLTEDHYFEYLARGASAHDAMPLAARSRVIDSPLLFAGFQPDAWEFRILLRGLLQMEGRDMLVKHRHFSVQMDVGSLMDPVSARRYIEQYLNSKVKLQLYWGDVHAFVNDLHARVKDHP